MTLQDDPCLQEKSLSRILFSLRWKSGEADHEEECLTEVSLCRDILPDPLLRSLLGKRSGEKVEMPFPAGTLVSPYEKGRCKSLPLSRFRGEVAPVDGRFYPQGLLRDVPGVYPETVVPFRCVGSGPEAFEADLNHPFACHESVLSATVLSVHDIDDPRGGAMKDVLEGVCDGPGMQARWKGRPTDFFLNEKAVFRRDDESDDVSFYARPRLVTHVDDKAVEKIGEIYGRLLRPGSRVLDLMAGWKSHVPGWLGLEALDGLGLNAEEMGANNRLTSSIVHDINRDIRLPFGDKTYDAVICSLSVEYLTRPVEVFHEVARVLRPGGLFVLTFSHRWFPPKVTALWRDLHPFERVGLVTEYFLRTGRFRDLSTLSIRGWPRPHRDRYFPRLATSDPVFAVWGIAQGEGA